MKKVVFIERPDLAEKILSGTSGFLVVDMREHDFVGGNITGAVNMPACEFNEIKALELGQQLLASNINLVVFHCFYCRMRGPTAAKLFDRVLKQHYPTSSIQVYVGMCVDLVGGYICSNTIIRRVLRGGWSKWKNEYKKNDKLVVNMPIPYH